MATFAAVVSDPETGQSYQVDVDGQDANRFLGREIGDEVDGAAVGLPEFTVEITGGSDEAGRPMHEKVGGDGLAEILSDGGTGFQPTRDGERRRVTIRGREVGEETVQLNLRIAQRGDQRPAVLLGDAEPEDVAEETPESTDATETESTDSATEADDADASEDAGDAESDEEHADEADDENATSDDGEAAEDEE